MGRQEGVGFLNILNELFASILHLFVLIDPFHPRSTSGEEQLCSEAKMRLRL